MNFDTGVSRYIIGVGTVKNYFPVDHRGNEYTVCEHCDFYIMRNRRCALTNELLPFPTTARGRECPLVLQKGEDDG